MFIEAFLIN